MPRRQLAATAEIEQTEGNQISENTIAEEYKQLEQKCDKVISKIKSRKNTNKNK